MRGRAETAGLTLLEVAVALAILGAGVVTCLQIFTGSLQLQARASRQLRVAMAARSKMDSLFAQELQAGCREDPPNAEGFLVRSCVTEAAWIEPLRKRAIATLAAAATTGSRVAARTARQPAPNPKSCNASRRASARSHG